MINLESVKTKSRKRLGRGIAAGGGKTAGRGTKGQKARAGYNLPRRFEGGQTPLSMRLPKLPGFKSHRPKKTVVSLDEISTHYKDGERVSLESLVKKGLIGPGETPKILNNGVLAKKVLLGEEVSASGPARKLFTPPEPKPNQKSQ
ncbi:MAG: 50S ribosomal protein L15 [Patescibacteria group bacterium]